MSITTKDIVGEIIEMEKEAGTWDDPPAFFIITPPLNPETDERPVVHVVHIREEGKELPSMLWFLGDVFLDPDKSIDAPPLDRGFLGLAVRWEGYGMKVESAAEMQEFIDSGKSIADDPRGVEVLGVLGIDTDGLYASGYMRGEEDTDMFAGHPDHVDGNLVHAARHLFEGLQAFAIRSTKSI